MEPTESCVPPGFRFHPNDEELVGYYLKKKIASQKIDLDVIREVDLYRIEPWDIQGRCRMGYEEQNEWYFFSHKDKKYPTGTRTNRATMAGFWKATGRDKAVHDKSKLIGMRKTLVFYKGRAPNGQKTDWIIHEYRLESDENGPPQEEGWVVCRAFKKKTNVNMNNNNNNSRCSSDHHQRWDSSSSSSTNNYYDHQQQTNFLCKQEMMMTDLNHLLFLNSDDEPFLQLPPLQTPSLILPSSSTFATDWRSLDKFVASQLSHDNEGDCRNDQGSGLGGGDLDESDEGLLDMALLLMQKSGRDEGINEILATNSESEGGILQI